MTLPLQRFTSPTARLEQNLRLRPVRSKVGDHKSNASSIHAQDQRLLLQRCCKPCSARCLHTRTGSPDTPISDLMFCEVKEQQTRGVHTCIFQLSLPAPLVLFG